jgi:hypothetical protein
MPLAASCRCRAVAQTGTAAATPRRSRLSTGTESLSTRPPNGESAITELEQFLAEVLTRRIEAEEAICNGDPAPPLAMWFSKNLGTLFGADATKKGVQEVRRFPLLASWFVNL